MKVLMLNGSCNPKGCTYTALTEVGKTLSSHRLQPVQQERLRIHR